MKTPLFFTNRDNAHEAMEIMAENGFVTSITSDGNIFVVVTVGHFNQKPKSAPSLKLMRAPHINQGATA